MISKKNLLKERIGVILHFALDQDTELYKTSTGDPDWNLVRGDMMNLIDAVFDCRVLND